MKFNSQVCTTKIQSERLLALGFKKETADMAWVGGVEIATDDYNRTNERLGAECPAWSLHRLIEIYNKTCIFWTDCLDNPYDAMVSRIANKIKWGELNKEYLEEI